MSEARNGFRCLVLASIACVGLTVVANAASAEEDTAQLMHLLRAAAHLERAGRQDLAAEIYAIVAAEAQAKRRRLVDGGGVPIGQMDSEAVRAQACPATEDQVFVEVKLVEFSWGKLCRSGMDLVSFRSFFESNGTPAILDEDGRISEFIELLCKEGLAQVLSQPKLRTISGQAAACEIAHDPATVSPDSLSRMRFDCTPRIIDQGKLSLDLDFRIYIAAHELARKNVAGGATDDGRSLGVKTQVEMQSGTTLILAGCLQAADADGISEAKSWLLLLTAGSERISDQSHSP